MNFLHSYNCHTKIFLLFHMIYSIYFRSLRCHCDSTPFLAPSLPALAEGDVPPRVLARPRPAGQAALPRPLLRRLRRLQRHASRRQGVRPQPQEGREGAGKKSSQVEEEEKKGVELDGRFSSTLAIH